MRTSKRLIEIKLLALSAACITAVQATGQVGASINRASTRSASTRLGRIGGDYTGRYGNPDELSSLINSSPGLNSNGFEQPNFLGTGWSMGRLPEAPLPQAFLYTAPSVKVKASPPPWNRYLRGDAASSLEGVSGLSAATNLSRRLSSAMPSGFPKSQSRFFGTEEVDRGYASFFDLKSSRDPGNEIEERDMTWVERLEYENDVLLAKKKQRALKLFKDGTNPATPNRSEILSEAQNALGLVRTLEQQSALPCMLLLHIALEKQQLQTAMSELTEAVDRDPRAFIDYLDLSDYYGDPSLLTETMQRNFDLSGASTSIYEASLQAYFAMVLDDEMRLRRSLQLMEQFENNEDVSQRYKALRTAMSAAARQRAAEAGGAVQRP